ncbi:hypothetical protein [Rhodoferax sp. PAMC 29310]|uniref:hypothetical protein n=1 Tax=Rhodoferax sp. PAMC 29310 TaxID=2822760 RepID=UPI001B327AF7|nr:hypothetical protein [Rhodoferax sp. PAMC 29310]
MKIIHCLSIAILAVALGRLAAGFSKFSGLAFGFVTGAEIPGSAITDNLKNSGKRFV